MQYTEYMNHSIYNLNFLSTNNNNNNNSSSIHSKLEKFLLYRRKMITLGATPSHQLLVLLLRIKKYNILHHMSLPSLQSRTNTLFLSLSSRLWCIKCNSNRTHPIATTPLLVSIIPFLLQINHLLSRNLKKKNIFHRQLPLPNLQATQNT